MVTIVTKKMMSISKRYCHYHDFYKLYKLDLVLNEHVLFIEDKKKEI